MKRQSSQRAFRRTHGGVCGVLEGTGIDEPTVLETADFGSEGNQKIRRERAGQKVTDGVKHSSRICFHE